MTSESYINRRMSNKPQIGFVSGADSSNFKSGWLHYGRNEHGIEREWDELRHVTLGEEHDWWEFNQTR